MSSKYMGLQPIAYGLLDGTATPAAFIGETIGFGAVTDSGTGDWTVAVDTQVGLPSSSANGGVVPITQAWQGALAAMRAAAPTIASATALDINASDFGATPAAADAVVGIVIMKWPNG